MKIDVKPSEIQSTVTRQDSTRMTIDNESLGHIIKSLTDMYPTRVLATIREYSTNAYDSHVEAGQTRPIEVTLPSAFNHNFVVQDWGVGMGHYELTEIFGIYGKSTKRHTDDQHGAFGLGSKSALTLVNSFNIESVKDGKKFVSIVRKDDEGIGNLDIISTTATDEPNGVKITIPAAKPSDFQHYAKQFFLMWQPGTVLVNGAEPTHISSSNFEQVGDLGYIGKSHSGRYGNGGITVNMGGVGYRVSNLSHDKLDEIYGSNVNYGIRSQEIVLNAPIGAVNLVPSREDVDMTDKTMDFVSQQTKALIKHFVENIYKKVDQVETRMKAVKLSYEFAFVGSRSEFTWQGEPIPDHIRTTFAQWIYQRHNGRKQKVDDRDASMRIHTDGKAILINTADATIENSTILRHLKSWSKSEDMALGRVFIGALPKEVNPWMQAMIDEGYLIVEAADKVAEKAKAYNREHRKRADRSGIPRDTLTYPTYTLDSEGELVSLALPIAELKTLDKDIYYVDQDTSARSGLIASPENLGYGQSSGILRGLRDYLPDNSALVVIAGNRKAESFVKRMGDVKVTDVIPVLTAKITKKLKAKVALSYEVASKLQGDYQMARNIQKFKGKKMKSKLIKDVIKHLDSESLHEAEIAKTFSAAGALLGWSNRTCNNVRFADKVEQQDVVEKFFAHYPLLNISFRGTRNHELTDEVLNALVDYINSIHETKGEFSL